MFSVFEPSAGYANVFKLSLFLRVPQGAVPRVRKDIPIGVAVEQGKPADVSGVTIARPATANAASSTLWRQ
jgi:hypothetical protein